ncbi:MAG: type sorting protein, partial [Candidatus Poribacteria bacterium]|nr:type sorting protein [Candidatus Poribacteria bacterium]
YKNYILQEKYNDQKVIPSSMTLRDEKWHFTVKPKDDSDYGDLKTSSDVTIGNTPPTATNLVIIPSKPTPEDILSFSYQYSDTDKDTENGTKIIWYKNDEQQVKYDNITAIPSIELITGQKWYVVIQPCDGTQYGETKQSKLVTIGEKTPVNPPFNTPPEATDLRISPEKPLSFRRVTEELMTTDNLQCEYKYTDSDNDSENDSEIRWYKNNVLQKAYNNKKVVSASDTVKGESWYFTVKPKDGKNFGDLKTSPTVTIINTPPTLTSINIKPTYPKKTDNLLCDYVYSDLDRDVENGTEIKWYKNDELQPSYNDLRIIPPVDLVKGQKWYCTVRLKDGTDFSELKTSAIVTVGNTAPVASNLIISPLQPLTTDDLTCSYEYTDADNDNEIGTDIRWYKDEELQSLYNDQKRVPQEETAKDQKWYFTIKPRDGILYGEVQKSSVVTIGDTPPTLSDISIIPVLPKKGDSLICHYTYKDANSDAETGTEIKWFKNNKQQTEFNNQTQISSSVLSKGEKWYFRIRTSYDKKFTDWLESPTITIGNSQPNAFAEVENYVVAVGSQIKFYGSKSSDADNDKLSYKWNFDANNNTSIDALEQDPIYVYENEGEYTVTLTVNDGEIDSAIASVKVKVEAKLTLISASYNIPDTKLILKFSKPIQSKAFDGEMIHMETADSGNVDLQIHGKYQPIINWTDPSEMLIDLSNSFPTAFGLVLAGVVNHQKVDLSLAEGIFMDTSGISNQPVSLVVDMISDRFEIGLIGDVNGSGTLTMYDAEVILQSSVSGTQTLPIYDSAMDVSRWLASHEYTYDAVMDIADLDKDGQISSYDTSLIMRKTSKRVPDSNTSVINPAFRKAMLKINHHDSARIDMSVVLDDSSGVYSVDFIITYDPQELVINRVSKSPVFSDWLFAQATPESGKLKISMAGLSAFNGNESIADLSFRFLMESTQLPKITGIQLNGRRISVSIENLPDHSALLQNYPNPCNNETWIPYLLPYQSKVYVGIYNSNGNIIRSFNLGIKEPGDYTDKSKAVYWDCRNEFGEKISNGIYFYEIRMDKYASLV